MTCAARRGLGLGLGPIPAVATSKGATSASVACTSTGNAAPCLLRRLHQAGRGNILAAYSARACSDVLRPQPLTIHDLGLWWWSVGVCQCQSVGCASQHVSCCYAPQQPERRQAGVQLPFPARCLCCHKPPSKPSGSLVQQARLGRCAVKHVPLAVVLSATSSTGMGPSPGSQQVAGHRTAGF